MSGQQNPVAAAMARAEAGEQRENVVAFSKTEQNERRAAAMALTLHIMRQSGRTTPTATDAQYCWAIADGADMLRKGTVALPVPGTDSETLRDAGHEGIAAIERAVLDHKAAS